MPRLVWTKKDVGDRESRRGAVNQVLIRRCLNGKTHRIEICGTVCIYALGGNPGN